MPCSLPHAFTWISQKFITIRRFLLAHLTNQETEAQSAHTSCPRLHSRCVAGQARPRSRICFSLQTMHFFFFFSPLCRAASYNPHKWEQLPLPRLCEQTNACLVAEDALVSLHMKWVWQKQSLPNGVMVWLKWCLNTAWYQTLFVVTDEIAAGLLMKSTLPPRGFGPCWFPPRRHPSPRSIHTHCSLLPLLQVSAQETPHHRGFTSILRQSAQPAPSQVPLLCFIFLGTYSHLTKHLFPHFRTPSWTGSLFSSLLHPLASQTMPVTCIFIEGLNEASQIPHGSVP